LTPSDTADAEIREIDGRRVSWLSIDGGKHRGAIGTAEGETITRAIARCRPRIPVVGRIASSGADVNEGVASLPRGRCPLADASGVVRSCSCSSARRCRALRSCSGSPITGHDHRRVRS
jgi:acetyl-CoA carboxylase carboxyltransferase component